MRKRSLTCSNLYLSWKYLFVIVWDWWKNYDLTIQILNLSGLLKNRLLYAVPKSKCFSRFIIIPVLVSTIIPRLFSTLASLAYVNLINVKLRVILLSLTNHFYLVCCLLSYYELEILATGAEKPGDKYGITLASSWLSTLQFWLLFFFLIIVLKLSIDAKPERIQNQFHNFF